MKRPMAPMLLTAATNKTRNRKQMRKTLLIVGTVATTMAFAQNSNVVSAFMALEDNKLAEAVGYIEPAITNEGTMVKEKTWRYRGMIYQRIAFSDDAALKAQFPDAMEKSIASFTKAKELDTKGAEKEGNDKALRGFQAMALNAGNDAFTAKEYDKAVQLYAQSEAIAKSFGEVDSNAVFNSALAYESKGDNAEALKRYQQCIAMGYDKAEIFRYAASLQKRGGDLNGAITTTQAGRKRHPNDKELMLDEVAFLQEAGRTACRPASSRARPIRKAVANPPSPRCTNGMTRPRPATKRASSATRSSSTATSTSACSTTTARPTNTRKPTTRRTTPSTKNSRRWRTTSS
jgi:tetratricopeptide (TPR) repeat protein